MDSGSGALIDNAAEGSLTSGSPYLEECVGGDVKCDFLKKTDAEFNLEIHSGMANGFASGILFGHERDKCDSCSPAFHEFCGIDNSDASAMSTYEDIEFSCQTPKRNIFDPFVPRQDENCFAPKKKAPYRQLKFDGERPSYWKRISFQDADCDEDSDVDEEILVRIAYRTFLEAVLSNQLQESGVMLSRTEATEAPSPLGCQTPPSTHFLSGIADTCPPAPLRTMLPLKRSIPPSLCRKLDFDSESS